MTKETILQPPMVQFDVFFPFNIDSIRPNFVRDLTPNLGLLFPSPPSAFVIAKILINGCGNIGDGAIEFLEFFGSTIG